MGLMPRTTLFGLLLLTSAAAAQPVVSFGDVTQEGIVVRQGRWLSLLARIERLAPDFEGRLVIRVGTHAFSSPIPVQEGHHRTVECLVAWPTGGVRSFAWSIEGTNGERKASGTGPPIEPR